MRFHEYCPWFLLCRTIQGKIQGDHRIVSCLLAPIHSTNQHKHKQPRLDSSRLVPVFFMTRVDGIESWQNWVKNSLSIKILLIGSLWAYAEKDIRTICYCEVNNSLAEEQLLVLVISYLPVVNGQCSHLHLQLIADQRRVQCRWHDGRRIWPVGLKK